MTEFTVNGNQYRTGRMDVMKQFHVARKLVPGLLGSVSGLIEVFRDKDAKVTDSLVEGVKYMAMAVSYMSVEDSEFVLNACLETCQRQNSGIWSNVMTGNRRMFDDIDLRDMLEIVWHVIQDTFSRFFPASLGSTLNPSGPQA